MTKHRPMTSKRFEMMEPSMDDCTTAIWPFLSATMLTYSRISDNRIAQGETRHRPTYDQLDGIAKRGIDQGTHGVAQLVSKLFRRKREHSGQRHDGHEVEREDDGRIPVQLPSDDAERHEYEQDIDVAAEQGVLSDVPGVCRRPDEDVRMIAAGCHLGIQEDVAEVGGPLLCISIEVRVEKCCMFVLGRVRARTGLSVVSCHCKESLKE
jgi:hypothetical protein